jgi:hypothetical protein
MSSPHHRPLRLGTRGSPLALAQAGRIAQQLREQCGRPTAVVTLATPGDQSTAPIERLGTTGVLPPPCARRCLAVRSTSSCTPADTRERRHPAAQARRR